MNGSRDGPALHLPAFDATLSRGELERLVTTCAQTLVASGVQHGDVVALAESNSVEFVIGFLAITWASAVALPLNPNNKRDEFFLFLEDAKATLVLVPASGRIEAETAAADLSIPAIGLEVEEDISFCLIMTSRSPGFQLSPPDPDIKLNPQPDDRVLILHTSGTTGKPKCVPHNHRNLCAALRNVAWTYDLSDDVSMHVMPLFHPHGLTQGLLAPLATGGSVILPAAGKFDPVTFWQDACQYGATYYTAVPTIHLMLLARADQDYPADNPPPLKFIRSCSAPLAPSTLHKLETTFGVPVLEAYAMSECNQMCSSPLPRRGGRKAGTVGPSAGDIQIAILSPAGDILATGERGEVCARGPSVTEGYLDNPDANEESFVDGWFHTGDEGVLDPDRYLTVTGRIKERINRGGEKISPNEIDSCLMAHPDVAEAVTFGAPDELYGQVVACAVRLSSDGGLRMETADRTAVAASIRKHVGDRLADFKVPAFVFVTDSIPKNATGKIQRRHVAEHFLAQVGELRSLAAVAAAGQDTSAIVTAVWREVLAERFTDASPDPQFDFFLQGGNSVRAMQAVSRLRESTGLNLPAAFVFMHRTHKQMVDAVNEARMRTVAVGTVPENALKHLPHLPRHQGAPVSLSQEQLLLLYEQDPQRTDYLVVEADWLNGAVDEVALRACYEFLISRHESLRTLFAAKGSEMVQIVLPADEAPPSWEVVDLGSVECPEEGALQMLQEEMKIPFNLYKAPPCQATLVRCSPGMYLFFIKVHHICFDGWSRGVLVKELSELYKGISQKDGSSAELDVILPNLPLQYADYSQWQRALVDSEASEQSIDYWKSHLEGAPPLLAFPTDFPRPSAPTGRGGVVPTAIPADVVKAASKLAGLLGTTIFTVLSAAFQLLLSRYARQEDVVIGTPSAGRGVGELEGLIGFLVNPVPMRLIVDKEESFNSLLRKAAQIVEGARRNNTIPIQRIAQAIGAQRSAGYSPIYQAVFVLQDENFKRQIELPGVTVERVPEEAFLQVAMFDLTLELVEQGDGSLLGSLKYSADLFKPSSVERMVSHFVRMLTSAVTTPNRAVKELDWLSDEEKAQLLTSFNNKKWDNISSPDDMAPPGELSYDAFVRFAESRPEANCVMDAKSGDTLTFKQVHWRSTGLALDLCAKGAKPGGVVGVLMERSMELYAVMLGVHKSGAGYVALDPEYPKERLVFLLECAGIGTIITHGDCVERTHLSEDIAERNICLMEDLDWAAYEDAGSKAGAMSALPRASPSDVCYVTFTSGSTGKPKGAQVTHVSAVNNCNFARTMLNLKPGEAFLLKTTTAFDASPSEHMIAMISGAMAVVLQPGGQKDIGMLIDAIAMVAPTRMGTLFAPPSLAAAMILDPKAKGLQHLQGMLVGGEAVEASLIEPLLETLPNSFPCNVYGPCETGPFVTANPGAAISDSGSCPIGWPIPNASLYVLDADLNLVPLGVDGELCIAGKAVGKGYIGRPDLTAEKFISNPFATGEHDQVLYRTGDLARWLPNGQIEFRGRTDHQVKIRGLRIEMGEIEATLAAIPGVSQSAVVVKEDLAKAKQLVGYISPKTVDTNVILAALRETLPGYMVPTVLIQMDHVPTLPNGKINRLSLPEPEWTGGPSYGGYVPPATPLESRIQVIWQETLGFSPISVIDDFFMVGGSSLSAMMVTAKLRAATGLAVPGSHLFQFRTIQELAGALTSSVLERLDEEMEEDLAARGALEDVTGVPLPLSFQQELYLHLHDVNPHSTAESLLFGIKINGEVDTKAMAVALNKVAQRHAAFRVRYVKSKVAGGETSTPMQIINPPEKAFFPLYHIDMTSVHAAQRASLKDMNMIQAFSRRMSTKAMRSSGLEMVRSCSAMAMSRRISSNGPDKAARLGKCSVPNSTPGLGPKQFMRHQPAKTTSFRRGATGLSIPSPFDTVKEDEGAADMPITIPECRKSVLLRSFSTLASSKSAGYAISYVPNVPGTAQEEDDTPDEVWHCYEKMCHLDIEILKIMHSEAKRPFELWTDAPHCRALLIDVNPQQHALMINIHHGVSDGWTFGVFFSEFSKLYEALREGQELSSIDIPLPSLQNTEYSRRQRSRYESGKMAKGLAFWQKALDGVKEELDLPFDHPRPLVSSYHGFTVPLVLGKSVVERLTTAAAAQKTTLTVVMLSCWRTMLHLVSRDTDFAIGWAMGGRTSEELNSMIGCVSNLAAIRTNLKGMSTFSEVVAAEANAVQNAQDHSTIPWLAVVRQAGRDWGMGPHPIFGVRVSILDLEGLTQGGLQLAGCKVEIFSRKPFMHTSKYDLELEMVQTPEGSFEGTLEYTTDRFERKTVERIARGLESVYEAVSANPNIGLATLEKVVQAVP